MMQDFQTRQCRNPSPTKRPLIIVHYPQTMFSPHEPLLAGVSPMDERLAQTCFSLGLLGRRKPLLPKSQTPIPKIQPELSHLLPNTTTTPTEQINPLTTSPYHLTNPQATKHPLSPNLHNPRFSLTLSTPQPHPFLPLSHPIIFTLPHHHTNLRKVKSETMQTPPHHHNSTKL